MVVWGLREVPITISLRERAEREMKCPREPAATPVMNQTFGEAVEFGELVIFVEGMIMELESSLVAVRIFGCGEDIWFLDLR